MRLQWTHAAEADRDAIYRHIEAEDARAALDLDERFEAVATRLSRFPKLGRPGRVEGTREFVAHRSYVLVYELEAETVRVLRVLHTARLWPPE